MRVFRFHDRVRSLAQQAVRAQKIRSRYVSRHRRDLAPGFKGQARGYEGSRFLGRLHHDDELGKTRDNAVSLRKSEKLRFGPGRIFRDERSARLQDAARELEV